MYYVYVLYIDNIPFYAGMTNNPVRRYVAHYYYRDCLTYNKVRYYACERGKMMEMRIVYCSLDRGEILRLEAIAIDALWNGDFNPLNRTSSSIRYFFKHLNVVRVEYPAIERLRNNIINEKTLAHVVQGQINILKENNYDIDKYIDMDNPAGISQRIRNHNSKGAQLGSQR